MYHVYLIFMYLLNITYAYYNPIPVGCVIVSTTKKVMFLIPSEYGGKNELVTIFTANNDTTIVNTIFNPVSRYLFIVHSNQTSSNTIYSSRLISTQQLSSTVYRLSLPSKLNISDAHRLVSFANDVTNNRAFLTDQAGNVTMFAISGLMLAKIDQPSTILNPIRSVLYNNKLDRLFVMTAESVWSCKNLDINALDCCKATQDLKSLRSMTFDSATSDTLLYIIENTTGIYDVPLNNEGCPTYPRAKGSSSSDFVYMHLAVDRDLFFLSAEAINNNKETYLIIRNSQTMTRSIKVDSPIVALHLSYPNRGLPISSEETCFNGINYSDYRIAVVLAALFGTFMGILICFNTLFCIDFFMTKSIIKGLKQQIPHDLLEDRWNKLVEEKYAKIALESELIAFDGFKLFVFIAY
jgi:hypothetical protein